MPHNFRILFARVGGQNANCANLDQGDGTFQLKKIKNLPGQPYNAEDGIVPADFNSDGLLEFHIPGAGRGQRFRAEIEERSRVLEHRLTRLHLHD